MIDFAKKFAVAFAIATLGGVIAATAAPVVPAKVVLPARAATSLADARRGFVTHLVATGEAQPAAPQPPAKVFDRIRYRSPAGALAAYVTPDPGDGKRHPAIVWITGGDSNSIDALWQPAPRSNDQTAAAYRKAGIVMMFPSLRGGNDNPGRREGFLGEVDDVIAAAKYLSSLKYVDPDRIYLGGHSTGGTLVMLVAESTTVFRAQFAFGPVGDVRAYGGRFVYHDPSNPKEALLRSPGYWLDSVRKPLFVIEAAGGNIDALRAMRSMNHNAAIGFLEVPGKDHFSVLAPANERIAAKILADTGPAMSIVLGPEDAAAISAR